jgi:hypothetical protein
MMLRRKHFKATTSASLLTRTREESFLEINDRSAPERTVVEFPWSSGTLNRSYDFAKFYGNGCDEVVLACQRVVESFIKSRKQRIATIANGCSVGLRHFLEFCIGVALRVGRPLSLEDIRLPLIEEYIGHLGRRDRASYASQRAAYGVPRVFS